MGGEQGIAETSGEFQCRVGGRRRIIDSETQCNGAEQSQENQRTACKRYNNKGIKKTGTNNQRHGSKILSSTQRKRGEESALDAVQERAGGGRQAGNNRTAKSCNTMRNVGTGGRQAVEQEGK